MHVIPVAAALDCEAITICARSIEDNASCAILYHYVATVLVLYALCYRLLMICSIKSYTYTHCYAVPNLETQFSGYTRE